MTATNVTTLTLRDEAIFLFLWKWKLATLNTLGALFFTNAGRRVAYNRLLKLQWAGFLRKRLDQTGRNFIWMLDKRGFAALGNRLPQLRENGYVSENPEHDILVNALHLGDWCVKFPSGVEVFTEQQLRRYMPEMFPTWVPACNAHRPDGYWHFKNGNESVTIALEVELAAKEKARYATTAKFYADAPVERILWLVSTPSLASKIQSAVSNTNTHRKAIHNFINLKDFQNHLWQANIVVGPERGFSVSQFLQRNLSKVMQTPMQTLTQSASTCMRDTLLNTGSSGRNRSGKLKFIEENFPD